jgi:branched-chain amino acid transport system permease protein
LRKSALPLALLLFAVTFPLYAPVYMLSRGIEVFCFAVFALSYDLLIGVTGIVSFGHALFFGAGAYTLGLMLKAKQPLLLAVPAVILVCGLLAALVGSLSLRVKGHFFAMITLAFAEVGHVIVQKWYEVTGGADGLSFRVPSFFFTKAHGYWIALTFMLLAYFFVRRITESPTGKVLHAIRENEFRAGALGYNVTAYKVFALVVSGILAGLSGGAFALLIQQGAAADWLTPDLTIQALLMTIIGGVGTLHGPMLGAGVVRLLSFYLAGLVSIHPLFGRWPLIFGSVYIGIVLFLPGGIVGTYHQKVRALLQRSLPTAGTAGGN